MRLPLFLTACVLALPGKPAAQSAPADSARSTKAGVYSREQAARGSDLYALNCVSCHTAASHAGPAFVAKWQGRALSELFSYVRTEMPKSDPGTLSDSEYIVLLAYLLKMNGMPPGSGELPGDSLALKKIRIDLKPDPSQDR
ncbi:MAG TPA: cytochrome c [Gemmatimonadales bacterium]|jgi:mono/diheme cytochrome c family protein|nr:cytochrome c [Gemmatimonadales bacterium]